MKALLRWVPIIVGLWLMPVRAQPDTSGLAAEAALAYAQGNYSQAASLYQNLVNRGVYDGVLFFNLGNAYFQSGQLGRALVSYLRAQATMPRDVDLNVNLARIRAARVDVLGDETDFLLALGNSTLDVLTLREMAALGWLAWLTEFALLAVALLRPHWDARIRVAIGSVGAMAVLITALLLARMWAITNRQMAVVIEPVVSVMSGPGQDYLELYQLHDAAELNSINRQGDWLRFSLPDGRQGWIPVTAVEILDT